MVPIRSPLIRSLLDQQFFHLVREVKNQDTPFDGFLKRTGFQQTPIFQNPQPKLNINIAFLWSHRELCLCHVTLGS